MKDVSMKNKFLSSLTVMTALSFCMAFASANAQTIPTVTDEPTPVDFPQRSSLGEMKEAMLPNLSDSTIKNPSPMAVVVSKKAAPSEQLLGRITSEVFHEMADLERGNVFLKLQAQREQLKNDLEKLKASYRQARLDEIEKRENVIRTRVEWMQEQEQIRQEILEKKMQTELLEKQVEEAEARKDALQTTVVPPQEQLIENDTTQEVKNVQFDEITQDAPVAPAEPAAPVEVVVQAPVDAFPPMTIMDIKGMKGKLTARLYGDDGVVFSVKVGTVIPSGHKVKKISKSEVIFEKNGKENRVTKAPMVVNVPKVADEAVVEE